MHFYPDASPMWLAVDGNPLEDITVLEGVRFVMKQGHIVTNAWKALSKNCDCVQELPPNPNQSIVRSFVNFAMHPSQA